MSNDIEPEGDSTTGGGTVEAERPGESSVAISQADLHESAGKRTPLFKRRLMIAAAAVVLLVGIIFGTRYYLHAISHESTDDAFIDGHIIQISPKVSGHVIKLHITDNQQVNEGDLLVEIDPRDFEARLAQARASLLAAQARHNSSQINVKLTSATSSAAVMQASSGLGQATSNVQSTRAQTEVMRSRLDQARVQIKTAQANAEQARAQSAAADAEATRAAADVTRYQQLYDRDEVSHQQFDQAVAAARVGKAQLEAARLKVAATDMQVADALAAEEVAANGLLQAESQIQESQARVGEARGQLAGANAAPDQVAASRSQVNVSSAEIEQAQAAVQQAELELSYTRIFAPESGRVTRKAVEEGALLQVGQVLFAIVPDDLWVNANFKETQLTFMQPGQSVEIDVDAYPDKAFRGHVDSIQAGSGAAFSLLPPENASGNYVKVVQRVPVKIVFDEPPDPTHSLGPGMSVVPEVKVK
ncbi:MAG TPA: HlyD family secretion protein [Blastocatellia bacterium]|nr:HlyD family secretion protein [Blastocatellia bacterium]